MKWFLNSLFGYGKYPRRPLPVFSDAKGKQFASDLKEIMDLEASLQAQSI